MSDKQEIKMTGFEPRDIYIKFEMSLSALEKLVYFLNSANIQYSDEKKESIDFVKDQFFPYIDSILKEFKNG